MISTVSWTFSQSSRNIASTLPTKSLYNEIGPVPVPTTMSPRGARRAAKPPLSNQRIQGWLRSVSFSNPVFSERQYSIGKAGRVQENSSDQRRPATNRAVQSRNRRWPQVVVHRGSNSDRPGDGGTRAGRHSSSNTTGPRESEVGVRGRRCIAESCREDDGVLARYEGFRSDERGLQRVLPGCTASADRGGSVPTSTGGKSGNRGGGNCGASVSVQPWEENVGGVLRMSGALGIVH